MGASVPAMLAFAAVFSLLYDAAGPYHWLPFVVFRREQRWSFLSVALVVALGGLARAASSLLSGLALGSAGESLANRFGPLAGAAEWAGISLLLWRWLLGPVALVLLGLWLVLRGASCRHAPADEQEQAPAADDGTPSPGAAGTAADPAVPSGMGANAVAVLGLAIVMLFSPSFEMLLYTEFSPSSSWAHILGTSALWLAAWLAFEVSIVCIATALLSGIGRSWSRRKAHIVHGAVLIVVAAVWLFASG